MSIHSRRIMTAIANVAVRMRHRKLPQVVKGRSQSFHGTPAAEGLKFGILMGLLMAVPTGLIFYGVNTIPLSGTMVDTIYQVVEKSIGGIVIGLVFGRGAEGELS